MKNKNFIRKLLIVLKPETDSETDSTLIDRIEAESFVAANTCMYMP